VDKRTVSHFDENARSVASSYEIADMKPLHQLLLRYLPAGKPVLEIGCGSGRDAASLLGEGLDVTAVDASAGMVSEAMARHPGLTGRVAHAEFPLPVDSPLLDKRYSGVVSIATVMHIPDVRLFEFAMQVRELLDPGGVLIISSSIGRGGLPGNRDESGRLLIERPPEELQLLFERLGFRYITRHETADATGRDLRWYTLIMERGASGISRSVDEIETIISHDRKDTTYKLALLRALCDIAQGEHRAAEWKTDGFVAVPLGLIAEKWLFYYWPLITADGYVEGVAIPQKRGRELKMMLGFRRNMRELIARYRDIGGISSMYNDYREGTVPQDMIPFVNNALRDIDKAIRNGPIIHAGGAIEGKDAYFGYEKEKKGRRKYESSDSAAETLGRVLVPVGTWREMCLIGHWISESLVIRWAELTSELSNGEVSMEKVVGLLLTFPETKRDVHSARAAFSDLSDLRCTWTGKPLLRGFAVDHMIPFSVAHNNDLWNLAPAEMRVNNSKSDKLVTVETLASSKGRIFTNWEVLQVRAPRRFELEVKRSLLQSPSCTSGWMESAFSGLKERVETLAVLRGMPRWNPPAVETSIGDSPPA
jgi:SAM-dependent methyltransferase